MRTTGAKTILNFHGIGDPSRVLDPDEDVVWLKERDFTEIIDSVAGDPRVRITFDDGNDSDVEIAAPVLAERGMTASFFVIAGKIGEPGYLTADGVRRLQAAGMTIGTHGMAHRRWRQLDDAAAAEEIVEARRKIEQITGTAVTVAACPFGWYDRAALRLVRNAGYAHLYTSDGGAADPSKWLQPRNTVTDGMTAAAIRAKLDTPEPLTSVATRTLKQLVKRWR